MKEKGNKNETMTKTKEDNGEVSVIRNILMGQFMAQSDASFETLKRDLGKTDDRINKRIDELEASINDRFAKLEASIDQRFANLSASASKDLEDLTQLTNKRFGLLEAELAETTKRLEFKIDEVSKDDKANLGEMLAQLSTSLINNK